MLPAAQICRIGEPLPQVFVAQAVNDHNANSLGTDQIEFYRILRAGAPRRFNLPSHRATGGRKHRAN